MIKNTRICFLIAVLSVFLMNVSTAYSQDISIGDITAADGTTITIPLIINNAPNLVKAFGVDISFCPNNLTYQECVFTGGPAENFFIKSCKVLGDSLDNIRVSGFDGVGFPQGTSGALVNLTFQANCTPGETCDLTLSGLVDDIATWTPGNGSFECACVPSGPEVCDNIDNDCDGSVDEDLTQTCGSDVGECQSGTQTCSGGTWGACVGEVTASAEVCDGLDNDCDGSTDEDLGSLSCGVGECARTVDACVAGQPQVCVPGDSTAEVCDGLDNDCDGSTDEDLGSLSCGVGECARTVDACLDGQPQECVPGDPTAEACDGLDNDCDGSTDEDLGSLSCGFGECARTVDACLDGQPQECVPGDPTTEICDGKDNDCNGQTDEIFADLGTTCTAGIGACEATGSVVCKADGSGTECNAVEGTPGTETCNNIDDNCDGSVDENLTRETTCGVGACSDNTGTETCEAGAWINDTCDPQAGATTETCDNIDNDCDGSVDEDLTQSCGSGVGECVSGTQTCAGGAWGVCEGEVGPAEESPAAGTCADGKDNDCDGLTDDSDSDCLCDPGAQRVCDSGFPGVCADGLQTCSQAGHWDACVANINPGDQTEVCDGLDNDCDGTPDEDLGSLSCGLGECARTVDACVDGQPQECVPGDPTTEVCDGLDNDCNGQTDEGFPLNFTYYSDSDQDTYGDPDGSIQTCMDNPPAGYVEDNTDCDDSDGAINPGATEICNDQIDNDCDGLVDGEDLTTYYLDNDGDGYGSGDGTPACEPPGENYVVVGGDCNDENQAVNPGATEICNTIDDDCDGSTDEDFADLGTSCTLGVGACTADGTMVCKVDGSATECDAIVGKPGTETCNNEDDDCDGSTDEDLTQSCGSDVGECQSGTQTCSSGVWGICEGEIAPVAETCDGLDNDCTGTADDNLTAPDNSKRDGVCAGSKQICDGVNGWQDDYSTVANYEEGAEVSCDGLDNDCDGTPDEDFPTLGNPCDGADTDLCEEGTVVCKEDQTGVECNDDPNENDLDLCNGQDDDCNEATDDGADETWLGTACDGDDTDACKEGDWECVTGTQSCSDNTDDTVELCNGLDDNCDGLVPFDETDADGDGVMVCAGDCNDADAAKNPDASEVCDGLDNNCNGEIDEGEGVKNTYYSDSDRDSYGDPNSTTAACHPSVGMVIDNTDCEPNDSAVYPGAPEVCGDEVVNDCDSEAGSEEAAGCDFSGTCTDGDTRPCNTGALGICATGIEDCVDGSWTGVCTADNGPVDEICNNRLDDNCDGIVDNCNTEFKTFVDLSINPILVCFQANQTLDGDPVVSLIKGNGLLSGLYNPCPNSSLPVYCAYFTPGSGGFDIVPDNGSEDVVISIEEVTPVGSEPGNAYARFHLETDFENASSFCLSETDMGVFSDFLHETGCDNEENASKTRCDVSFVNPVFDPPLTGNCDVDQATITEADGSAFAGAIGDTLVTSVVDVSLPEGVTLKGGVVTITLSFELPEGWTRQEFEDNLKIKHSSDGGLTWTSAYISNVVVHWDTMTITFDTGSLSMFAGTSKQSVAAATFDTSADDGDEIKGRGCSVIDQNMPTGNAVANTLVFLLPLIVFGIRRKRGKKIK